MTTEPRDLDALDMGQIRNRLAMEPGDRVRAAVIAANNVRALLRGWSSDGGSGVAKDLRALETIRAARDEESDP
jgi:hypothetical protein